MNPGVMLFLSGTIFANVLFTFWFLSHNAARYAKAWNAGNDKAYEDCCRWNRENHYPPPPPGNVKVAK